MQKQIRASHLLCKIINADECSIPQRQRRCVILVREFSVPGSLAVRLIGIAYDSISQAEQYVPTTNYPGRDVDSCSLCASERNNVSSARGHRTRFDFLMAFSTSAPILSSCCWEKTTSRSRASFNLSLSSGPPRMGKPSKRSFLSLLPLSELIVSCLQMRHETTLDDIFAPDFFKGLFRHSF